MGKEKACDLFILKIRSYFFFSLLPRQKQLEYSIMDLFININVAEDSKKKKRLFVLNQWSYEILMRCGNDMMSGQEETFIICACFGKINAQWAVRHVFHNGVSWKDLKQIHIVSVEQICDATVGRAHTEQEVRFRTFHMCLIPTQENYCKCLFNFIIAQICIYFFCFLSATRV